MRGWYSRGYLPHFDEPDRIQFITYRLADSMPQAFLDTADEALRRGEFTEAGRRKRIEYYLDQGHGACWLRDPVIAAMVEGNLRHFDGERYRLLAWCVMPNHVHVLAEMMGGFPLEDVTHSWKSYTAHEINRVLNRLGRVWQAESFDRYIRNEQHFERVVGYIEDNPVSAGLAKKAEDWPYSSASFRGEWL